MFLSLKDFQVRYRNFGLEIDALTLDRGTNTAVVGANGSGKTTFIEGILGIHPDVSGEKVWNSGTSVFDKIGSGVQLQSSGFASQFLVRDIILLHKILYKNQDMTLFDDFEMKELTGKRYSNLSRGQKQRVDLFIALAHSPQQLFLDEPGTGLDAAFSKIFMHYFQKFAYDQEKSAIFACHSPDELAVASNVLWLCDGKVKGFGDKETLIKTHLGDHKVTFMALDKDKKQQLADDAASKLDMSSLTRKSTADTLTLYGSSKVKEWAKNTVKQHDLSSYAISVVTDKDFLDFLSGKER